MLRKLVAVLGILFIVLYILLPKMFLPQDDFSLNAVPEAPDYSKEKAWAALPNKEDGADIEIEADGVIDKQNDAKIDVFYLYPTSYIIGGDWNASLDNALANYIVREGMLTQQASAFNGIGKIYAPFYRQVSLGGQMQQERPEEKQQALDLAYSDIERAFNYFIDNYNQERPFIIASHSQGTTHAKPLLQYLFKKRPDVARRFIAGYIIGNTVIEEELTATLDICRTPLQTQCYLSWNAILEGGDDKHWHDKGRPVCVNPLSWRYDEEAIDKTQNLGAIPITGPRYIDATNPQHVGARCENGILWITQPEGWNYKLALFPGGGYHAYDYNLFYMNIRQNLEVRVSNYLANSQI